MNAPDPGADDTVRLARPTAEPEPQLQRQPPPLPPAAEKTSRRGVLAVAGVVGGACLLGGAGALFWSRQKAPAPTQQASVRVPPPQVAPPPPVQPPAPPEFAIRTGTEAEIRDNVPNGLTVFRFAQDGRILVLDFASLHQQASMLNRVAALIEKDGQPRDRVLDDAALDRAIRVGGDTPDTYYYGHDYSAQALGYFFVLAAKNEVALDPEEERLRRLLLQVGWLAPGVNAGVISIPAVGSDPNMTLTARATILHHELSHGLFFADPEYAAFVRRFWETVLTGAERKGVKTFLGAEGYDTRNEELMYNEMQAYLMFTPDPAFFTPERVGMTPERLTEVQSEFLRGMPSGWLRDSLAGGGGILKVSHPGR